LTPIVLRLGRRFPFERGRIAASVGVHLLAMLGAAACHFTVSAVCGRLAGQEFYLTHPFFEVVGRIFVRNIHLELFTYGGVLALVHAFEYHRRFRERELAAARLETELAQAELEALKMQLHPHFLFNTLNTVAVLVRKQDTQGSIRMLSGLSDLLRLALENVGKQLVPLKQELDFVDRYLEIEKTRFQDRLAVQMNIEPEVLHAAVPNLILQPLVENAIRHGIAPRASAGHISIDARQVDGTLVIKVKDDGKGLGQGWDPAACTGVGLRNVRSRIEQLYGGEHCFSIEENAEGGVLVTIQIPYRADALEPIYG
jgi:signal transduction histidine kinase